MKKFIIILFLPILLNCQSILLRDAPQYGWAGDFDGGATGEYASKTSPVNLDLNGTERCSTQTDRDFETSIGNWTDEGNHTIVQSNTQKHAGTYSLKVTSSAAGDATTNYFSLPSVNFTPLVSGEKYTVEAWGNGTGIVSETDLVANGDFALGSGNTFTSWTVSKSGTSDVAENATGGVSGSRAIDLIVDGSNSLLVISNTGSFIAGRTYKYSLYAKVNTTTAIIQVGNATSNATLTINTTLTNYTGYFIAGSSEVISIKRASAAGKTVTIDNFTIQEVTPPSITLVCGGQSKTITNISCVPGTFTKVVWNFQATANEVGQPIRAYLNQADVTYFDDFSIKKSYDRAKLVWFKTSNTGANKMLVERYASSNGLKLSITSGNVLTAVIGDGTNTVTCTGTTNVCDGLWHLAGVKADRIGNMQLYLDGVVEGTAQSITGVGSIVSTTTLQIGYLSADYFNGQIGDTQLSRFDDINASNLNFLTAKRNGIPRTFIGGNALTVGLYKWKGSTDAQMLLDWSGTGNNLTGTNISTADQVRGTYPSK